MKNNSAFCYYTGYWYCLDCISLDEKVIPYKILDDFDYSEYSVSIESKKEIDKLFDKYIISIPYTSPFISKNAEFYEVMVKLLTILILIIQLIRF